MKRNTLLTFIWLVFGCLCWVGCDEDEPPEENEEEIINRVFLEFTNTSDPDDIVTAEWYDADAEGSGAPTIEEIELTAGVTYELELSFQNTLEEDVEEITEEIEENDDEHKILFSFTEGLFPSPEGDGNVDDPTDIINYKDFDENGLPVGLETEWTAGDSDMTGVFRVILKLQPDSKSETSSVDDGVSEIDVTLPVSII